MFFDDVTPNTSAYMIAGYIMFFVVSLIYLGSLYLRNRNLHRDLDTLEGLEKEKEAPAPVAAAMPRTVAPGSTATRAKAGPAKKAPAKKPARKAVKKAAKRR